MQLNLLQNTNNPQSAQACKSLCNSGFGGSGNQLLAAANANNSDNSGVRCANTNNRGANTNANYGFPLLRLLGLRQRHNTQANNNNKPHCRNLAPQKPANWWRVLTPKAARAAMVCWLAKEYEVKQRLVEGCKASANVLFGNRHKVNKYMVSYGA